MKRAELLKITVFTACVLGLYQVLVAIIMGLQYFGCIDLLSLSSRTVAIRILYFSRHDSDFHETRIPIGSLFSQMHKFAVVTINETPDTSVRTLWFMIISFIIGVLTVIISFRILVNLNKSRYSDVSSSAFAAINCISIIFDGTCAIFYFTDVHSTKTMNDLVKRVNGTIVGTGGYNPDTSYTGVIMALFTAKGGIGPVLLIFCTMVAACSCGKIARSDSDSSVDSLKPIPRRPRRGHGPLEMARPRRIRPSRFRTISRSDPGYAAFLASLEYKPPQDTVTTSTPEEVTTRLAPTPPLPQSDVTATSTDNSRQTTKYFPDNKFMDWPDSDNMYFPGTGDSCAETLI